MRHTLGLILAGCLLLPPVGAQPDPPPATLTREEMARDIGYYQEVVQRAWAWEEDKRRHFGIDVSEHCRAMRSRLPETCSRAQFLVLMEELVAQLQDGHAAVRDLEQGFEPQAQLPFDLYPGPDGALLVGPWEALAPHDVAPAWFAPGARVVSWQGRPIDHAVSSLTLRTPASTPQQRLFRVARQMTHCPPQGLVQLRVRTSEGQLRSFIARPRSRYWTVTPTFASHEGGIGVLKVPSFSPYYGREDRHQLWLEELHEGLAALSKSEVKVLDLRGNAGGEDAFVSALLHHFMEPGFELYRSAQRGSPELQRLYQERGWGRAPAEGIGELFPYTPAPPGCDCPPYLGGLFVLQDAGSFSATDNALAVLKDQRPDTILVGRPSAGGWGEPHRIARLPVSDFELTLTVRYGIRKNGVPLEGRGIMPHIQVPYTQEALAQGQDVDLEAVQRQVEETD